MTSKTDNDLIIQCLNGDLKAFDHLVIKYQKPLFNGCIRMLGSYDDAQDVVQTAFIKAYENLESFDKKMKFFSWMYKIMVNESLNHLSRRKPTTELDENAAADAKTPEEKFRGGLLREKVQNALMELSPIYRTMVVLRYFADLSYREIAFVFEIPEKTVRSRLYSARQQLGGIIAARGITAYEQ